MGLFDFFKSKKNSDPGKNTENTIESAYINEGGHGDNFMGLFGKNDLNDVIMKTMHLSMEGKIDLNKSFQLVEYDLNKNGIVKTKTLVVIQEGNPPQMYSMFPYIKTDYSIPFETRKIIKWKHSNVIEADISGIGRNEFAISFFATDYIENIDIYNAKKDLEIYISAIAFNMDESIIDNTKYNANFSQDFTAYMPVQNENPKINSNCVYNFVGKVNHFKKYVLDDGKEGFIVNTILITHENPDFLTVDIFVNKENMSFDEIHEGMKISGVLWFQGEIKK